MKTSSDPEARTARPPWPVIAAAFIPPVYFVLIGFVLLGTTSQDLGDFGTLALIAFALAALELLFSAGVWSGSRGAWIVSMAVHGLLVVAGLLALPWALYLVPFSCWIIPSVLALLLLSLPPSVRWSKSVR
ncbi:hypothetical protein L0U85_16860 [Glycomyces sp. L485]|uniref:hypothetical protein n=1 Tax=Glycomyces sp. L485 TaxID=2909235 RepID=UPI001F4B7DEB|nr:hypothetical protein [Glycomyces sp. L485]MCH7232512.1 hypothetical protein [Glycomyces sp. L485]